MTWQMLLSRFGKHGGVTLVTSTPQIRSLVTQPRPQGLLAFQNGGGSGEDPGTQQITCLQRGWRCIQNGGYGEKGEKNWVRDAKVKINKMAEKAEVQIKKKQEKQTGFACKSLRNTAKC